MGIKLCHISTVHNLFDARIFYKECNALQEAGYEVNYIVSCSGDKIVNGINVIALPEIRGRFKRISIKLFYALKKALKIKAKVYHFHDPELIAMGIIMKLLGFKVIYDIHDLVYKQIKEKEWIGSKWLRKAAQKIYLLFEWIAVNFFDRVILAEERFKEDFFNRYPLKKYKFALIRNYSILTLIDKTEPIPKENDKFIAIYVGALTRIRGTREIIEAVGLLDGKVNLWLLGNWETDAFRKECEGLSGVRYVRYFGYKKMDEIYSYAKAADLGLALLHKTEHYSFIQPTKIFEYMACRIPIIMSDFPLWKELFFDCALFADPQNPEEIAGKISMLIEDEKLRINLSKNGRKLVENQYSWEVESKRLVNMYKAILNQ